MCCGMRCRYENYEGECTTGSEKPADAMCQRDSMADKYEEEYGVTPTDEQLDRWIETLTNH